MIGIQKICATSVVILAGLFCFGCTQNAPSLPVLPVENLVLVNSGSIERYAGVVTENLLEYDFLIGGDEVKEIAFVSADCGCTRLLFSPGDVFEFSQPFQVIVQLQGTRPGKGQQDFFIKFSDDTFISCRLTYEYAPLPFVMPEELRFFADVHEKEIVFFFPNETDITIQSITQPDGITWRREISREGHCEVRLIFEVDRSLFFDNPIGMITVFTSSKVKPHFSLPYLVLQQ